MCIVQTIDMRPNILFLTLLHLLILVAVHGAVWDPPLEAGQDCRPNKLLMVNCNNCQCDATGKVGHDGKPGHCTHRVCNEPPCENGKEEIAYDLRCLCTNQKWYCPYTNK